MWSSSLTKDQTQAPCVVSAAFSTEPARKPLAISAHIVAETLASAVKEDKEEKSRGQKEKPKLIVCSISVCCGSPKNPQWIITLNKEFVQFIAKEISIQNQNAFKHTAKTKCNLKLYIIETKNKYNKRCPSLSFGESYKIYWTRQNSASWS